MMISSYSRKRTKLGAFYGLIAGLFFTLAAWGMDAFLLLRHNSSLPFLKFFPALLICVPAAVIAGYMTARFEKGWVSLLLWVGLSILFTYLVINIPIKIAPWLTTRLLPEFTTLMRFEDLTSLGHYWFYGVFAIGFTCILCGILENLLIDQSLASSGAFGAIVPFIVCLAIMTGAGFSGDLLMTSKFREPLVTIDTLLENGATYYNQEVEKTEARKMHLSIVNPLDELVLQPHTLTLVSTDNYLGLMKVLVDFEGKYALCHIAYSQPTFCELTHLRINRTEQFAYGLGSKHRVDFFKSDIIEFNNFPHLLTT
ncbi:MAG: hypothetical protein PHR54_05090 [Anaerolineaceae bacterium]|nr:hypothetical protein [Anaerolineaceae bacterium]